MRLGRAEPRTAGVGRVRQEELGKAEGERRVARRERERERPRDWRWEQWEHWTVTRVGREGDQCQSNLSPMARERQETAANGSRSSASECGVRVQNHRRGEF